MIARLVRNINPYPLGAGVTAPSPGVRPVINRQKREGKAPSLEPDGATPPSKWLWTGCSTKVRRRRHGEPAHAGLGLPEADTGWPQNGDGFRSCVHIGARLHSNGTRRKAPSQGHANLSWAWRRNGYTERGNLSRALSELALNESEGSLEKATARLSSRRSQAVCRDRVGCPKPALSQAEGKLMPGVTPRIRWRGAGDREGQGAGRSCALDRRF